MEENSKLSAYLNYYSKRCVPSGVYRVGLGGYSTVGVRGRSRDAVIFFT